MEEFSTLFKTAPIAIKFNRFLSIGFKKAALPSTRFSHQEGSPIIGFDNPDDALRWIKYTAKDDQKNSIEAVLCNLEVLENESYSFVRTLRSEPFFSFIPIIAIAPPNKKLDKAAILQEGIDDCYALPVDWSTILKRVEYLRTNKIKIQQHVHERDELGLDFPLSKRIFDIFFSVVALLALFPLFLIVTTIIFLESRGPVIYTSKRVGAGYRVFKFYKFRSMVKDADAKLQNLSHKNQYKPQNGSQAVSFIKIKNDPRITRFGHFLRKTSIDELPQFFNVLKGDMSIVGNRPLPLYEAKQLVTDHQVKRFLAPAGLTGLWQVTKRGKDDVSASERIALDIEYANTYSFWGDLKIISRTIPAMIQEETV